MLGCRKRSSASTIQLLAWASRDCVFTDTGSSRKGVTSCEGTDWYFSYNWSWGFVKQGDDLNRNWCDWITPGCNDCRMCWHTPSTGYRCGADTGVNDDTFEKVIFQTGKNVIFMKTQLQANTTSLYILY